MLDRFRAWLGQGSQSKASAAGPAMAAYGIGQPIWTERSYWRFAEEAYVKNAVAFRCVKMISRSAATIPWLLVDRRGKEIDDHALLALLARPAPTVGGHSLFEALYAYLLLSGNSYLEAVAAGKSAPRELWTLRPDRMRVLEGPAGVPTGYQYEANGKIVRWESDPITGKGPILHLKEFHPINDWYGMSPVDPAAQSIDRHNAATAHNTALIQNGARPAGALIFKPITVGGNAQSAPKEVIEAAEARLNSRHAGAANAGRPFIFGGDVSWQEMGLSPKDMDFNESKLDAARDICTAFGVPHILIVPGSSTYNNVREAKLELYEDTVLPLVDKVVDELNNWLVPQFGEGVRLDVDKDEVSALTLRREIKQKSTLELFDKRIITREEAREALQYEKLTDEDAAELDAAVKADVAPKKAQALTAHVNSGLLPDDALAEGLAQQLIADDVYPGLEQAIKDSDAEPVRLAPDGPVDPANPKGPDNPSADPAE